jgi:hypothetical protein
MRVLFIYVFVKHEIVSIEISFYSLCNLVEWYKEEQYSILTTVFIAG